MSQYLLASLLMTATVALAAADPSPGLSLSTTRGIQGGKGGTELRTTQRAPGGEARPVGATGMQPNEGAQFPLIIAPYIQVPGNGSPPSMTNPRPTPHRP
jgi:hypothetical protein